MARLDKTYVHFLAWVRLIPRRALGTCICCTPLELSGLKRTYQCPPTGHTTFEIKRRNNQESLRP